MKQPTLKSVRELQKLQTLRMELNKGLESLKGKQIIDGKDGIQKLLQTINDA